MKKILILTIYTLAMIDVSILEVFQRRTEQIQKLCGKNCFDLAKITIYLFPLPFVGRLLYGLLLESHTTVLPIHIFIVFISLYIGHRDTKKLEEISRKFHEDQKSDAIQINSAFIELLPNRLLNVAMLTFFCLIGPIGPFEIWLLTETIAFYLMSCTPLPPSESKVGEWLKQVKAAVQEKYAPNLEPVPVSSN